MSNMPTDAEIESLWDCYVGEPTAKLPLTRGDKLAFARAIEAEVRKQDDALILQLVEALERAKKHHFTTSLPLVIENYGSKIKCANEGSIVWRGLAPAAITAALARLGEKT